MLVELDLSNLSSNGEIGTIMSTLWNTIYISEVSKCKESNTKNWRHLVQLCSDGCTYFDLQVGGWLGFETSYKWCNNNIIVTFRNYSRSLLLGVDGETLHIIHFDSSVRSHRSYFLPTYLRELRVEIERMDRRIPFSGVHTKRKGQTGVEVGWNRMELFAQCKKIDSSFRQGRLYGGRLSNLWFCCIEFSWSLC